MFKPRLSNTLYSILTRYMAFMGLMLFAVDLDDPEFKAALKAAVDEATAPLLTKRDELIAENRKLKQGKQVSPEDLEKLEQEKEGLKVELQKANKDLKTANTSLEKITNDLKAEQGFTQKLLVQNGLTAELSKAGVTNAAALKGASSILAGQVQIVTEGDARVAKVGDKALADFVGEWAKTDEGKYYVAAQNNSGGGGNGGNGGGDKKPVGKIDGTDAERAAHFASKHPELNQT
jgi:hypothetical protein